VLVYDWRAESREQYEAVERLVHRYDCVFVRMIADGRCEALVSHWGLLDHYTVERDGFSVKVESREITRRWLWSIGFACSTVAALIVSLWFAGPTLTVAMNALLVGGIAVFVVFRLAMFMVEGRRVQAVVPDLKDWVRLDVPGDAG
jgi:hypothetical protein